MSIRSFFCLAIIAAGSLSLAGCSTAVWYEAMKRSAENECRRQPADEGERCLARLNKKSYEEYERERSAQKK
jgi:hypothetical protein